MPDIFYSIQYRFESLHTSISSKTGHLVDFGLAIFIRHNIQFYCNAVIRTCFSHYSWPFFSTAINVSRVDRKSGDTFVFSFSQSHLMTIEASFPLTLGSFPIVFYLTTINRFIENVSYQMQSMQRTLLFHSKVTSAGFFPITFIFLLCFINTATNSSSSSNSSNNNNDNTIEKLFEYYENLTYFPDSTH